MDDLISRKEAMSHPFANGQYDHKNANKHFIMGFESYKEWLSDLPPAEKTGKWIKIDKYDKESNVQCSACLEEFDYIDGVCYLCHGYELPPFCPSCGARMR